MPANQPTVPSFVPHKKPRRRRVASSIFVIISFLIFFISAGLGVAVFLYDKQVNASLDSKRQESIDREKSLENSEIMREAENLVRLSKRIDIATQLLAQHTAITPFFKHLEALTLPNIQFTSLSLSRESGDVKARLSGLAKDYPTIAEQSDAFNSKINTNNFFRNPIFTDFSETEEGPISFVLTFDVDPALLLFVNP